MPEENILQLGAVAIIFLFTVKEFFSYLKSKQEGKNGNANGKVLLELKGISENHLKEINKTVRDGDEKVVQTINQGNDKIVQAINSGNQKIIELLGRIDGRLDK